MKANISDLLLRRTFKRAEWNKPYISKLCINLARRPAIRKRLLKCHIYRITYSFHPIVLLRAIKLNKIIFLDEYYYELKLNELFSRNELNIVVFRFYLLFVNKRANEPDCQECELQFFRLFHYQ